MPQQIAVPARIQLRRTRGWRMPPNTVKVDRTTKWGNPFVPGQPVPFGPLKGQIVADKRHAYQLYRSFAPLNPTLKAQAQAELAGKNLACWCGQDDPYEDCCHAAVLLELANAPREKAVEPQRWLWRVFGLGWPRGHEDCTNEWGAWTEISAEDAQRLAQEPEAKESYQFVPFQVRDPRDPPMPQVSETFVGETPRERQQ